jgi:signal transduction histidine kinase
MKTRSLGVIFIAAVIVPSILLAVLSIRSAGREEAWMEKQMASTLDAEVTHAAGLASAEVGRVIDELKSGLGVPSGGDYGRILTRWKSASALVAVPFMLSPRYGILWPPSDSRADKEQKRFLAENGAFLSDRTATPVLQNIAVRYQEAIMAAGAEAATSKAQVQTQTQSQVPAQAQAQGQAEGLELARRDEKLKDESKVSPALVPESRAAKEPPADTPSTAAPAPSMRAAPAAPASRQQAIDAFAQSPALQTRVYEEARAKGDQLNARNVEPMAASAGASAGGAADASPAEGTPAPMVAAPAPAGPTETEALDKELDKPARAGAAAQTTVPAKPAPVKKSAAPAKEPPSQFVVTSQLLSQIASQGDFGLIPRFIGEKLVFLFWERQVDGRIAGCEIAGGVFRGRIAGVLTSTWSPVRILTLLDENGAPLATPPDTTARDWRRPFVSREIGESLPRWEAAAYLTRPDVISAQARSSSLVIWIMVMILFISVAGGGTMVLSSVYGEMRLAQQKATFVTNVSHELKTPLTSISLFVDLLRRKGPLPQPKKEQYLSLMASETERLTRLINNVLDFSREKESRRYSMAVLDASAVTGELVESQRVRLESRGFSLSLEPASAAIVRADPEALKQVLLNLLSNAEKYSAEKKEISVAVSREAGSVLVTVRDRGIGIQEKEREKVFREFYRVDDSLSSGVQGTGLGLTIARRIARDHGGDIACGPRSGGGTEFVVRLPAADAGEAPK